MPRQGVNIWSRKCTARDNRSHGVTARFFLAAKTGEILSFGGGGQFRPFTCPGKGKLGGEARLPMVRKIIQSVPIDGTRWRNEFVNRHENGGVGIHYGVAHRGVMPTQRAIRLGPSKGNCSQYASLNPEDARSHDLSICW